MRVNRRYFLSYLGSTALGLFALDSLGNIEAVAAPVAGGTLNARNVPKFVAPLVVLPVMPPSSPNAYSIAMRQISQQILPRPFAATEVWAYGSTADDRTFHSPAWTIEARRGVATEVTWINELKDANGHYLPHLLPVDPTLHWANPPGPRDMRSTFTTTPGPYKGPVPIVTHVHGMENVEDWSDGYPEAWYLPAASNLSPDHAREGTWYDFFRGKSGGRGWASGQATYRYPNSQRPSALWFHDHTLGITRLNLYAGPAGFYIIRSEAASDHPTVAGGNNTATLPDGRYEIAFVVQDRSFNADGSLYTGLALTLRPLCRPVYSERRRVANLGTRILRQLHAGERPGLALPFGRAATLPPSHPERIQLALPDSEIQRPRRRHLADRDGGRISARTGQDEAALAGPAERADVIVDFAKVRPGQNITLRNIGPDGPYQTDKVGARRTHARPAGSCSFALIEDLATLISPAIRSPGSARYRSPWRWA